MKSDDERSSPEPLDTSGSSLERWLLRSAELDDRDGASAEEATLELLLAEQRASQSRKLRRIAALTVAGAAAAAAALALLLTRPSERLQPAVSVEPVRASPIPSASVTKPAPIEDPCTRTFRATGSAPMIDDFEDRNGRVLLSEGRDGPWLVFNDLTGTQEPASGQTWHPSLIPGQRGASRRGLHTKGSAFKDWGTTNSVKLVERGCYDASAYAGISFYARGPSRVSVMVQMSDVMEVEFGGNCQGKCYDAHHQTFEFDRRWRRYTLLWDELAQKGFGPAVAFDPRRLQAIAFNVAPADTPFDFWIDDVSFVRR